MQAAAQMLPWVVAKVTRKQKRVCEARGDEAEVGMLEAQRSGKRRVGARGMAEGWDNECHRFSLSIEVCRQTGSVGIVGRLWQA